MKNILASLIVLLSLTAVGCGGVLNSDMIDESHASDLRAPAGVWNYGGMFLASYGTNQWLPMQGMMVRQVAFEYPANCRLDFQSVRVVYMEQSFVQELAFAGQKTVGSVVQDFYRLPSGIPYGASQIQVQVRNQTGSPCHVDWYTSMSTY